MIFDDFGKIIFSESELWDPETQVVLLDPRFAPELRDLRISFGASMVVGSCCRTTKRNTAVGGHPRSLHIYDEPKQLGQRGTLAIDILTPDDEYRWKLMDAATDFGWAIGVYPAHFHLDLRRVLGLPPKLFIA